MNAEDIVAFVEHELRQQGAALNSRQVKAATSVLVFHFNLAIEDLQSQINQLRIDLEAKGEK